MLRLTRKLKFLCIGTVTALAIFAGITSFNRYGESEAGYIVKKTCENAFHYEITDGVAYPEFNDYFYYTIMVDDNYIKVQVPYKVFVEYNLGDHFKVNRYSNELTKKYWGYSVTILGIDVPAQIVNKEYAR